MSKVPKNPIYESFAMLHPNGDLMCYTNKKRADWYIKLKLAEWVNDTTFKLIFEPRGKGKTHLLFYNQKMKNICVVCGTDKNINKHHVVPYVFRSRFPVQYKNNTHHDILPTCTNCHEAYEEKATVLKKELVEMEGLTLQRNKTKQDILNRKIKNARNTLKMYFNKELKDKKGNICVIPKGKLNLLIQLANQSLIEDEQVKEEHWADIIVRKLIHEKDIENFIYMWRQHFLDYAKPQFLPKHWSVNHSILD